MLDQKLIVKISVTNINYLIYSYIYIHTWEKNEKQIKKSFVGAIF